MRVTVLSRSGRKILSDVLLKDDAVVEDLKQALYSHNKKYYPTRQRFTLPLPSSPPGISVKATVLQDGKKLSEYESSNSELTVIFKDLGPQIGFKTVFFWEYFGPLILYPIFYFFPNLFYSRHLLQSNKSAQNAQTLALIYWSFHYSKRILETFFVHRFSHATMPIINLFRNCSYYWAFAVFISFFLNHPLYTPPPTWQLYLGLVFSIICQFENLYCHIILRNLRSGKGNGVKGYMIPKGFLFNSITCANYTTEIGGWFGFNIATQTLSGFLFLLAGTYQMAIWAIAKHARLKNIFDGKDGREKYPRRWIMLPPFF